MPPKILPAFFLCCMVFVYGIPKAQSVKPGLVITESPTSTSFPLFSVGTTPAFYYDADDAKVVGITAAAFTQDIQLISGRAMQLKTSETITGDFAIVAGTIGDATLIDELVRLKKLNIDSLRNQWERFSITVINQPYGKAKKLLVIAGSDRRGTAFGIFHLSRLMGVSPFVWWADVSPVKRNQLFVSGSYASHTPSVKYRGIFINDEDWGLHPWAAKHMDSTLKDIGPKTYAKVFELLLRLKANYIWPAMHPCTKAFYYYKENPKVADDYAIVVGGSHCEPMLRNNVFEWAENYEHEYGVKPGEWRYDLNKDQIYKYWDDRVKEATSYESVYTVGMRGVHDGSMPGPKDPDLKLKLLQDVITDQRKIFDSRFAKPANEVPQIFVPYKEVLSLYRRGLQLPDDVTIIWPDDNHGYIRQLPNEAERARRGGHGVYYHLSYWGAPQDYLWLSSISPSLIAYEMEKAYRYNAKNLWVFNIGDIKPAELEMQFALDMAWDIKKWNSANAAGYAKAWAEETFGKAHAEEIAAIKKEYYLLAAAGKPEHLNAVAFTTLQINARLQRYTRLSERAGKLNGRISPALRDAYYQLVLYPVLGAKLMNEKILYARLSILKNDSAFAEKSKSSFNEIANITSHYNQNISNGKWNGIMSWRPRELAVFNMPVTVASADSGKIDSLKSNYTKPVAKWAVPAFHFTGKRDTAGYKLVVLDGLGTTGQALTVVSTQSGQQAISENTPVFVEYDVNLPAGEYDLIIKCLPSFDVVKSRRLQYAVSINGEAPQPANVHAEADSREWKENVVRGYSQGKTKHTLTKSKNTLRVYLHDNNLVLDKIEFFSANK